MLIDAAADAGRRGALKLESFLAGRPSSPANPAGASLWISQPPPGTSIPALPSSSVSARRPTASGSPATSALRRRAGRGRGGGRARRHRSRPTPCRRDRHRGRRPPVRDLDPGAPAPLGKSDNYPRSVARIGAAPARAILEVSGGQGPQHLVTELARAIVSGGREVAVVFGSEAISTARHFAKAEDKPDFTETVDGGLEDRGYGLRGLVSMSGRARPDRRPEPVRAVRERARARLGQTRDEYARDGRAVRAVHPGRGQQPALRGTDRAHRRRAGHADRAQPTDRRPLPAVRRRPRSGQPGCRGGAHVGRGRRLGVRGGSMGVPARSRRPARTRPVRPADLSPARPPSWPAARARGRRHRRRPSSPRSTSTAASRSRCPTSPTDSAWLRTIRAG